MCIDCSDNEDEAVTGSNDAGEAKLDVAFYKIRIFVTMRIRVFGLELAIHTQVLRITIKEKRGGSLEMVIRN